MFKKNKKPVEGDKSYKEKIIQDNLKSYDPTHFQKNLTDKINIYSLYQNSQGISNENKNSSKKPALTSGKRSHNNNNNGGFQASNHSAGVTQVQGFQSMTSREVLNLAESLKNIMNDTQKPSSIPKKSTSNSKEKGNISSSVLRKLLRKKKNKNNSCFYKKTKKIVHPKPLFDQVSVTRLHR
jgi:hypothetical protein